jgi:hypothetical protein
MVGLVTETLAISHDLKLTNTHTVLGVGPATVFRLSTERGKVTLVGPSTQQELAELPFKGPATAGFGLFPPYLKTEADPAYKILWAF